MATTITCYEHDLKVTDLRDRIQQRIRMSNGLHNDPRSSVGASKLRTRKVIIRRHMALAERSGMLTRRTRKCWARGSVENRSLCTPCSRFARQHPANQDGKRGKYERVEDISSTIVQCAHAIKHRHLVKPLCQTSQFHDLYSRKDDAHSYTK